MWEPESAGIDSVALWRFIREQVYSLPGVDSALDAFTVLVTGSRAADIYTEMSDVDLDVLCPEPVYRSVQRASFEAGRVNSEDSFWFVLREDDWHRYFGHLMGRPHFSLTSLDKVEEHFRDYDDVGIWIWTNARVLADPGDQFGRIRGAWTGYPRDMLVRKLKYRWLLAGFWDVEVYPHHHSRDDELLAAGTAILNSVNELLRFFLLVEGRPFPYTEKLMRVAAGTKLGREFAPMLQRAVDLAIGRAETKLRVWQRLERAFEMLACYDASEECRRLEDACAQAMIEAGVSRAWVEADYDNIGELLTGSLGPVP
jgi:hypothetical protein